MFRTHESAIAWKAGWLALLVHVILLGALIFSFNWKAAHTVVAVSEVELWDALPNDSKPAPKPKSKVKKEMPKIKSPEPVQKPKVIEPKIEEPKVEAAKPDVDIALEKKKKEEEQKKRDAEELAEKKREKEAKAKAEKEKTLAKLQKELLEESNSKENPNEELKKLQAEMRGDASKPTLAANKGVVNEYMAKIQAKIRGNVNRSLCGEGNPELKFKVSLMPTGEFSNNPVLTKSSGNAACDSAVERAIIASEPFPLPPDPDALAEFRNLNLNFKPNAE
jgi:colicin import membrane protein